MSLIEPRSRLLFRLPPGRRTLGARRIDRKWVISITSPAVMASFHSSRNASMIMAALLWLIPHRAAVRFANLLLDTRIAEFLSEVAYTQTVFDLLPVRKTWAGSSVACYQLPG